MKFMEAAFKLAKGRWVFPCRPDGRKSLAKRRFKDATTGVAVIRRWGAIDLMRRIEITIRRGSYRKRTRHDARGAQ